MKTVRVLVVEDSVTVRKRLCEVLAADPEVTVVAEAVDGKSAIELCLETRPDVITMDMMLPVMTGLAATEYIMAHCPTPILIVSSSINRGEAFETFDALAAGAVDVLEKPDGSEADGLWEERFVSTVKLVSRIRVITHPRGRLGFLGEPRSVVPMEVAGPRAGRQCEVVAIGASTGGPGAIVEVLKALPATIPFPLLFVLHISELFATSFAGWLEQQIGRRVRIAADGDRLGDSAGSVSMAPSNRHLIVEGGRLRLLDDPERHSCRPSIDVLFESVAKEYAAASAACLLTGMGRDGAAGLLAVRLAGGQTIAQDEATSIVYGMPREAVLLGAAERVLPLGEIGPALSALALPRGRP